MRPDAVVMRPSLLFGPGDSFFTRFASLTRLLPVLPLAGADTRFQPVYAGDVAAAIVRAVEGNVPGGRVYEFGGPQVATLRELVEYVLRITQRRRFLVPRVGRRRRGCRARCSAPSTGSPSASWRTSW